MKIYNKLVRDKIPEIIESDGKICKTSILSDDAYMNALDKKLCEEIDEYKESKSLDELADILEVLYAICIARGHTVDELETVRAKKASLRGAFDKKIFLEYVDE